MFYYISGKVAATEPGMAVIDAGGVGYAINTSYTSARSVRTGEQATFYTYLHVREGVFELYGFVRKEELSCFRQLIAVSGVGPKAALAILSAVTPEKLALCVISGDEKALTAAPGIGKKLAQRILLEMKDKMSRDQLEAAGSASGVSLPGPEASGGTMEDALAALAVLGYPRAVAVGALQGVDTAGMATDEIVRAALKRLF
ncbi:MAG: Holliday junction branch migration protein RuvA [Clostridiaceae bacterium]|nr:Holliday junction branch migration protein RuvA [Clostridia bacterium]MDY3870425.1 Holliday junction branch migration protein RuvA [Clostridiaceae bacterium]